MGKGQLGRLGLWRLYPFEALAEISDFAAGFVHRVPKKTNEVKADLQNSTASQGDCSWEEIVAFGCGTWIFATGFEYDGIVFARLTAERKKFRIKTYENRLLPLQIFLTQKNDTWVPF